MQTSNPATLAPARPLANGRRWGDAMGVTIEGVTKEFGVTPALHGVSLEIRPGELIALLGPSGSGKTTLLRILAGLDFPTSGRVLFGDEDASRLPVQDRRIGFVFQNYALFRHMTAFENIAFGLKARPAAIRPRRAEIRRRVEELLALVQLEGYGGRYPAQLSGGQRQRIALARALAVEPRLLLLDEPFGALDAQVRRDLRRWLAELHQETGHTTVFVTHDQEEALELSDRVVVMREGRIEQIGTADEIYDEPATSFVAGFIGETNLLPVTLSGGRAFFAGEPLDLGPLPAGEGRMVLAFRPHDVEILAGGGGLAGRLLTERRHGAVRRLEIGLAEGRRVEFDVPAGAERPADGIWRIRPRRCRLYAA